MALIHNAFPAKLFQIKDVSSSNSVFINPKRLEVVVYCNYNEKLTSLSILSNLKREKRVTANPSSTKAISEPAKLSVTNEIKDDYEQKLSLEHLILKSISSAERECAEQLEKLGSVSDEEVIHDLRVALRRLRSSFRTYDYFLDLPKNVTVKKISNLLRMMGNVRDNDVMQETIQSFVPYIEKLSKSDSKLLSSIKKGMEKERRRHLQAAVKELKSKTTQKLVKDIQSWIEVPSFTKNYISVVHSPALLTVPSLLFPHVSSLYLNPSWDTTALNYESENEDDGEEEEDESYKKGEAMSAEMTNDSNSIVEYSPHCEIHELRKIMRELRYRMEMVNDVYVDKDKFSQSLQRLKNLQKILGDLRDVQVAASYLLSKSFQSSTVSHSVSSKFNKIWSDWLKEKNTLFEQEGREMLYHAISKPKQTKTLVMEEENSKGVKKVKEEKVKQERKFGYMAEKDNTPTFSETSHLHDASDPHSHNVPSKDLHNAAPHADHIFSPAKFSDVLSVSDSESDFPSVTFPSSFDRDDASDSHSENHEKKYAFREVNKSKGKKGSNGATFDIPSLDENHGKGARKNRARGENN